MGYKEEMVDIIKADHRHYEVIYCPRCKWPFHCPTSQFDDRIECRACESKDK